MPVKKTNMQSKPLQESVSIPHITINQPILTNEQLEVLRTKLSPKQFALLQAQLTETKNKELAEKRKKTSCYCGQTIRDVKKNLYYTLVWSGVGNARNQNIEINVRDTATGELFNTDKVKDSSCISFEEMAKLMKCENVQEFTQNFIDNHSKAFEIL